MNTSDWAEAAHEWFDRYHSAIVEGTFSPQEFFYDLHPIDEDLWQRFRTHPVLSNVALDNWQPTDFDVFEQVRGWQPLLRKLPKVPDYRLLTLIRRNLLKPLTDQDNHGLVSRHQWTLMEALRWKYGYYQRPEVLAAIQSNRSKKKDEMDSVEKNIGAMRKALEDRSLHVSVPTEGDSRGRFVVWKNKEPAQPGQILVSTRPYCMAVYDLASDSVCFHCGRKTTRDTVRELTLMCPKCQVWSYCSRACQREFKSLHEMECSNLQSLLDQSTAIGVPCFKAQLVYRAVLLKENNRTEWLKMMDLQDHLDDFKTESAVEENSFLDQATRLSEWMLENKLVSDDISVQTLVHLFLSVNINAIGLGSGAVGLFPGMPSMFNHSCLENVTHGWNDRDAVLDFRAVEHISMNQECCISYVSNLEEGTAERNESLTRYKFFCCQCARCLSPTEDGRLDSVREWKSCMQSLERGESNYVVATYQRLVQLSEVLFPSYFVTKGWAMEECAHSMMQDTRLLKDAVDLLQQAGQQYTICRGEESDLVRRVNDAIKDTLDQINKLLPSKQEDVVSDRLQETAMENDSKEYEEEEEDAPLWSKVLIEIKTYEPADDWNVLATKIYSHWAQDSVIQWCRSHRVYELGFGIQTLIVACQLKESVQTREELCEEIQEGFEDTIQNADVIEIQDYSY